MNRLCRSASRFQVAVKALSLLLNQTIFPRGFQIKSRAITVTFAHEHSFHPVYTRSVWSFRGEGGQELSYWDDKAYASIWPFAPTAGNEVVKSAPEPAAPVAVAAQPNGGSKDDVEMDAFLSSFDPPAPVPAPQTNPAPVDNALLAGQDLKESDVVDVQGEQQPQADQPSTTSEVTMQDVISTNGHTAPAPEPQAVSAEPSPVIPQVPTEASPTAEATKTAEEALGSNKVRICARDVPQPRLTF